MKNKAVVGLITVAVLVVISFGWYYYQGPCGVNVVAKSTEEIDALIADWDDAFSLASSTSRIALASPVGELQGLASDARDLEVPACLQEVQEHLEDGMEKAVEGFLAFMSEEPDNVVNVKMQTYAREFREMEIAKQLILACAPFCD